MKRDLPSSSRGGKGGHGKGGDGPDRKRPRPAYMARNENDNETDLNKKNANKRINLKVRFSPPCSRPSHFTACAVLLMRHAVKPSPKSIYPQSAQNVL